jgi:ribosomal protein S18 acetylase RimI-like enzyme
MAGRTAALTVRPKRTSDDEFILALSERVFAVYSTVPSASMSAMLTQRGAEVAIAEVGRTKIGFVVVSFERLRRDFGPWTRPVIARLDAIAVRPDAQGRGVGRVLLAHVEEIARAADAVTISLRTAETNLRARHLFESSGFMTLLELEDMYKDHQRAFAMMKPL